MQDMNLLANLLFVKANSHEGFQQSTDATPMQVENYSLWRLRDRPGQKSLTGFAAQNFTRSAAHEAAPSAIWTSTAEGRTDQSSSQNNLKKPILTLDFADISHAFASRETREEQSSLPAADLQSRPPDSLHSLVSMAQQLSSRQTSGHTEGHVEGEEQGPPKRDDGAEDNVERFDDRQQDGNGSATQDDSPIDVPAGSAPVQHVAQSAGELEAACGALPEQHFPRATSFESAAPHTAETKGAPEPVGHGQDISLQVAQQIAAQARQRCDMLKGPPRSSREDPAFQANYFAASRLHFIGSWKARIEALAASMANNAPKACPPARGSSRAIIHIDMDCFFACVAGACTCSPFW